MASGSVFTLLEGPTIRERMINDRYGSIAHVSTMYKTVGNYSLLNGMIELWINKYFT